MDADALIATSPHGVFVVGRDSVVVFANAAAVTLAGLGDVASLIGRSLIKDVHPDHTLQARSLLTGVGEGGGSRPVYLRLERDDEQWIAVRATAVPDSDLVQLAIVDVTEQRRSARRLRMSEQRFRAAFDSSQIGMALVDGQREYLLVNNALATMLGRPVAWFAGRTVDDVTLPEDLQINLEIARQMLTAGSRVEVRKRYLHDDGHVVHAVVSAVRLPSEDPDHVTLVEVEDVTARLTAEAELRRMASHDVLTELPGRAMLMGRLGAALQSRRHDDALVAVLFVDLDNIKQVNDSRGHAAGDAVLQESAVRLRATVRPQDTVGRFGGDEFLIIAAGVAGQDEASALADRVQTALAVPVPYDRDEVTVSASVGVALCAPEGTLPEQLIADADAAMYRAKALGKRRYEVFDELMRARAAERSRIEGLLRTAAARDRIVVHYQPIVDLPTRAVVGVEALMRIRDDDGVLLAPGVFLDVAQATGLLPGLDEIVLDRAITQVMRWRNENRLDLMLSVNVCPGQLVGNLGAQVETALAGSGMPPSRLLLELTEQTIIDSGTAADQAIQGVRALGVRFAVDDFGTGYSSLTHLRRFPISVVKIDRSFVTSLPDQPDDVVIVRTIVDMSRQLSLGCTVEGVETEKQYDALRAMAPPYGQGFLFGRPTPAGEVPALLDGLGVLNRLG